MPVYLGDVAKSTVGKLRKYEVVHLTGVFVDVAPSLARPSEVGMPLPQHVGRHELRVVAGERGKENLFLSSVGCGWRHGGQRVVEVVEERELFLLARLGRRVEKLLVDVCQHVHYD